MASNEYNDMAELIKEYYDVPVGTYLNQSISINSVTLVCDIYRVESETVLTSSVFTGCTAVDANTQIVIGKNMSVASGTTLTPPYRCKGIVIGDVGTFTNEGTISMTARGASGEGKNIQLTSDYMINAVGGTGGVKTGSSGNGVDGNSPSVGILSCGGGGSGSTSSSNYNGGAGGSGTSFSGGAGGGGAYGQNGQSGSNTGGSGGAATTFHQQFVAVSGGAGNPPGTNHSPGGDSREVLTTSGNGYTAGTGNGTGGLIIIISNEIISSGSFLAQGVMNQLAYSPRTDYAARGENGGASGGGCIVLLSRKNNISGTYSVNGGNKATIDNGTSSMAAYFGGAGGAGVYASYIVPDLILSNLAVEIAISDTNHLDNIEPSEGVRLLGMIDDDELYYEAMGTRHRAMNTDVDLSVIHAPGTTGQVDGHIYSTDETVVGKWIDGRNVYEKILTFNMPATSDMVNVPLGFQLDNTILFTGVLIYDINTNIQVPIPFSTTDSSLQAYECVFMLRGNNHSSLPNTLGYKGIGNYTHGRPVIITMRYTKTTDTA